uniref:Uncharacterized protein n=1 Tax=Ananas comosus var. bracteatus TaxID=296719 RepID=A0A6V7QCV2_ANACO|nr:unnamed protein product [Ananas comosus var. bracteatus]
MLAALETCGLKKEFDPSNKPLLIGVALLAGIASNQELESRRLELLSSRFQPKRTLKKYLIKDVPVPEPPVVVPPPPVIIPPVVSGPSSSDSAATRPSTSDH